jgi:hypothetical protein
MLQKNLLPNPKHAKPEKSKISKESELKSPLSA